MCQLDFIKIKCLCCGDLTFWPDWVCSFCDGIADRFGLFWRNSTIRKDDDQARPGYYPSG